MPGNVGDKAKTLRDKTKNAVAKMEGSRTHPSSPKGETYRNKPKATSMAPNEKNKKKSYGRPIRESAAEERKRKSGK
jgi:hypothetical protein